MPSDRRSTVLSSVLVGALLAGLAPGVHAEASVDRTADGPTAQTLPNSLGELPDLPEGLASFGAAVLDDGLYVYGGHIGRTHQHSVDNLSHHFRVLDLSAPETGWTDLGAVPGLQGLAVVAQGREICRIGGLDARNEQGAGDEDLVSVDTVACFDVDRREWTELPPLPRPRSSHDAVVVGDSIVVAGGWQLRGAGNDAVWHDTAVILDRSVAEPAWRSVPQPFQRRALAVASDGHRVAVLGGLGEEGTSRRVDLFDPSTDTWAQGPDLPAPAGRMKGFGVSAFGVDGRILMSGADGRVHALDATPGSAFWWEGAAELDTPRFFHRLLPHRERLLVIAGAHRGGHLASIESLDLRSLDWSIDQAPVAEPSRSGATWPGFRGKGDGRAPYDDLPTRWSPTEGVTWRVPIPGVGQSQPVVWGDRVIVSSIDGEQKDTLIASALSLDTGEVIWRRRFSASQQIESSELVSHAAPTPLVVDDRQMVIFWESGDVIAFGRDGDDLWRRSLTDDYGPFLGNHGVASSPVRTADAVVLQVTHDGPSYFVALDPADGSVRWKVDRPEGVAWTTPSVVDGPDGHVIVSSAAGRAEALDAATGEQLWHYAGIERNNVPSAVVDGDRIVVASSNAGHNFALRRGGSGELDERAVVWRSEGVTSGFGSPIVHGECVLFVNKAGVVTCVGREDGAERWRHRLPNGTWASPIATADRVYFFTEKGETVVLGRGADGPEVVAENRLEVDGRIHGAAAAPGALILRTDGEVLRIGGERRDPSVDSTTAQR